MSATPTRITGFATALVLTMSALTACSDPPAPRVEAPPGADEIGGGVAFFLTHEGRKTARVRGDTAVFLDAASMVRLIGIEAVFLDEEGLNASRIKADSGLFREDDDVLTLWGSVLFGDLDETFELQTSELVYDAGANRVSSDSAVVVTAGGRTRQGACFDGDPLLADWTICPR